MPFPRFFGSRVVGVERGGCVEEKAIQQRDAADEAGAAAGRLAPSSQLIPVLSRPRRRSKRPLEVFDWVPAVTALAPWQDALLGAI